MSNLTEKAIVEAFVALLNERSLDKITVREIAQKCGINRNTFYYHFHDIYDLLEHVLRQEEQTLVANIDNVHTLQQTFEEATRFVRENKTAVYHIYTSVNHDMLAKYLYSASEICMRSYIQNQCVNLEPSPQDLEDIVFLYSSMLEGAIINILRAMLRRL